MLKIIALCLIFLSTLFSSTFAANDDPQADVAIGLVSKFMDAMVRSLKEGGDNPLQQPEAAKYFFADLIPRIDPGELGADPILGGQDGNITDLEIALDTDQPPLQGVYPVKAAFKSFDQPRTVVFYVIVDTSIAPKMRIIQFDADGVSYK